MNITQILSLLCAGIVLLPVAAVFAALFDPWSDTWAHIRQYLLADYITTTLTLMVGVAVLTGIVGVGLAWCVTMLNFPGRRVFEFMVLLPLAIPTYVLAFIYRNLIDLSLPPTLSVIIVESLSFYIYVYLFVRASFLEQSVCILEAGRVGGCNALECFYRLALPLARPAMMAGIALALMEGVNDFGSMNLFGLSTLTTGIYKIWNGYGEVTTAAQLASLLTLFVLLLLGLERYLRYNSIFANTTNRRRHLPRYKISGGKAWLATICCGAIVLLATVIPIGTLIYWTLQAENFDWGLHLWDPLQHSLGIACVGVIVVLAICLILSYAHRWHKSAWMQFVIRLSSMGYAIPGTVLALSLFIFLNAIERYVVQPLAQFWPVLDVDQFLTVGWFALILAYTIRFMNFGFSSIEVGFSKIPRTIDEAARMSGAGAWTVFRLVHFELLTGGLFAGAVLIFVEIIKELPATLMLRPFNFDTLAVKTYQLASDEKIFEAAIPSMVMVLCGFVAVCIFYGLLQNDRPREKISS